MKVRANDKSFSLTPDVVSVEYFQRQRIVFVARLPLEVSLQLLLLSLFDSFLFLSFILFGEFVY